MGWETEEVTNSKEMLLATLSMGGVGLGSLISGMILKNGRIKIIMICNIVSIIATFMSIWLNWTLMLIGRFIFSFVAGIAVAAAPKIIEETVPPHLIDRGFGQSSNAIICFGLFLSMVVGIAAPTEPRDLGTSDFWKIFYLIQVPFLVISLVLMIFYHKYDSLQHHVKRGEKDVAMIILGRVYPQEEISVREAIYS